MRKTRGFRSSSNLSAICARMPAPRRRNIPRRLELDLLEPRVVMSYSGPLIHAVNYSPTWNGWSASGAFFDSDFASDATVDIWGREKNGVPDLSPNNMTDGSQGRNDLANIAAAGFNVVRLYDWSPTRSDNGGTDNAHDNFLNYAYSLRPNDGYSQHLQVIVPVSAYFLSNDKYAWSGGNSQGYTDPVLNGQVSYAFDAAPQAIQDDLTAFIQSITINGQISPDVFAISVGNELEGTFQDQAPNGTANGAPVSVAAASKLARVEWWMVNLEQQLAQIPGGSSVLITSPVSTADLSNTNPVLASPTSWFHDFIEGVTVGDTVPHNTHNPTPQNQDALNGTFNFSFEGNGQAVTGSIPGLSSIPTSVVRPYTDWYINTYQAYQNATGFKNLLTAYDTGGKDHTGWDWAWPGQKFKVPLLITEMGVYRSQYDPDLKPDDRGGRTIDLTAAGQKSQSDELTAEAKAIETYVKDQRAKPEGSEVMGYTLFEWSDEPTRKTGSEANFGLEMMAGTQSTASLQGNYPAPTTLFTASTNAETFAGGSIPVQSYPVQQLFAVKAASGKTLLEEMTTIFKRAALLQRRKPR
jgi:hypothetical protein